jgi:hypothetical protein
VRFVTCFEVDREDCVKAGEVAGELLAGWS